jgi:hypothetical protein
MADREKMEKALLDIEKLVRCNMAIPRDIRDKIQRIIICEAEINPPREVK